MSGVDRWVRRWWAGDAGVPGRIADVLAAPAEGAFRAAAALRGRGFDGGWIGVERAGVPVVSVGNLTVGGAGKTPFAAWLARRLADGGRRPAVVLRGYGADEVSLHREWNPSIPVFAASRRIDGARRAAEAGAEVVVLDDGFQHRRLARDVDIVLIDATRPPDRDALLPAGFLREPPSALARADAVVITHAELVTPAEITRIEALIARYARPGTPVGVVEHRWAGLDVYGPDAGAREVSWLEGRSVVAACAIGHPGGFLAGVGRSGAVCRASVVLGDHDPYEAKVVERLKRTLGRHDPELLIVTAKDWAKLGPRGVDWGRPVVVPRLEVGFRQGEDAIRRLIESLPDQAGPAAVSLRASG